MYWMSLYGETLENQCEVSLIIPHWFLWRQKPRNFHTMQVLSTWCYKSCRNVTDWYSIRCTTVYVQIKALITKQASLILTGGYHKQKTDSLTCNVMKHRHNNPVTTLTNTNLELSNAFDTWTKQKNIAKKTQNRTRSKRMLIWHHVFMVNWNIIK